METLTAIEKISYEKIDLTLFPNHDLTGIKAWNSLLEKKALKEEIPNTEEIEEFRDTVIMPDIPKTEEERKQKEEEYKIHWQQKKQKFLPEEQEKKEQWLQKRGVIEESYLLPSGERLDPAGDDNYLKGGDSDTYGTAYGAGFYDTSLFMAGDIVVGVFFEEGPLEEEWTPEDMDTAFNSTVDALNQFINDQPNAQISFTFIKEVDGQGYPILPPSDYRTYINDLRNTYQTHWSYMIRIFTGDYRGSAAYFGPSAKIYNDNLREGYTILHETMHIFGAMDQYYTAYRSPIDRWGYLNIVNANSKYNDGNGFFEGAGEGLPDIMISGWGIHNPIGVYSRGQIGWQDSDGDGILDPLDTAPHTLILDKTGANPLTYTGRATDIALPNTYEEDYPIYSDVTLNTISNVEYRINGNAWISAIPQDGSFDSAEEDFILTTPSLKNGEYKIEIRATNSVGNKETRYATDKMIIEDSVETNIHPFSAFSINPPMGSLETEFIFDASESNDIEDDPSHLEVRWDFEDDGTWDTEFSVTKTATFIYPDEGIKTVRLEVKDTQGLIQAITKEVEVKSFNLSPVAQFTSTPANQHGDSSPFAVALDATESWDGEDEAEDLQVRWDFEDDGIWDTGYSNSKVIEHAYELSPTSMTERWQVRLEVMDSNGNTNQTIRDVWAVTYNNPPLFGNFSGELVDSLLFYVGSASGLERAYGVYVLGDYAYVADHVLGLKVIDIHDPANPIIVGSYDAPNSNSVYALGNYVYLTVGTSLKIIDVSNPYEPNLTGSFTASASGVYVSGDYAYVAAGYDGLKIINISNPANPVFIGSYDPYESDPPFAESVYVVDNYAYLAYGTIGLVIVDIGNPAVPILAGSYNLESYARDVYVLNNYAYVAYDSLGLQIVDISNPAAPAYVGSFDTPGLAYGVKVSGQYAYIADYMGGLQILDISNPSAPNFVDSYWAPGFSRDVSVQDGYAYLVDYNMYILEKSSGLIISMDVSDLDSDTTWDGLLEYRCDFNNDAIWDTDFSSDNYIHIPLTQYSLVCEARDRFGANDISDVINITNICGDANGDGFVDIDDAVYLIDYIFTGGPAPVPLEVGDVDGNGSVDIDDVMYLVNYIFSSGQGPVCGDSGSAMNKSGDPTGGMTLDEFLNEYPMVRDYVYQPKTIGMQSSKIMR
ncbi:MAG: PKD domain-containing protein [Candidatus Omnitrophota bacterium]